jgi:hypothetical protein
VAIVDEFLGEIHQVGCRAEVGLNGEGVLT